MGLRTRWGCQVLPWYEDSKHNHRVDVDELLRRYAKGQRDFSRTGPFGGVTGVNLKGCDLRGANLRGANFRSANFSGAILSASVAGSQQRVADLGGADLIGADLSGAILSEAILEGARLSRADLSNADLSDADLTDANLYAANLSGANLSEAFLCRAVLSKARLNGAHLTGTNLSSANLQAADLGGAVMTGAILNETVFADVDLSSRKLDLLKVVHRGPSVVDSRTLARSRGRIPSEFLAGCGVSEWEVEHAKVYDPALTPSEISESMYRAFEARIQRPIQFYSVFISHSHADKLFARSIHDTLQESGIRCWLDEKQLKPGDDILDSIDHGIRLWDKVLLCASQQSLSSWWVDVELEKAFEKEQRLMKERGRKVIVLIPLALDDYLFEGWRSGKASHVRSRVAGNFKGWQSPSFKFKQAVIPLIRALRADAGGREPPPPSRL